MDNDAADRFDHRVIVCANFGHITLIGQPSFGTFDEFIRVSG